MLAARSVPFSKSHALFGQASYDLMTEIRLHLKGRGIKIQVAKLHIFTKLNIRLHIFPFK